MFFLSLQFFQIPPYLLTRTSSCSLSLCVSKKRKQNKKLNKPYQQQKNMESLLCWSTTTNHEAFPGVLLYPVPLQWRKRIFPLPAGSNCK